ncbi:hypothetical protein [Pseudomonas taetrolens]|uniref:hypothetical protein n=1 Tax=Pseudomonas taetrolens TaxID=47884 RepID=UPI0009E46C71|nr:hypothetical protein [Pseudomonas taetrolens]
MLGGNSLWLLLASAALLAHLLRINRTRAEVHLVIAVCMLGTAVAAATTPGVHQRIHT